MNPNDDQLEFTIKHLDLLLEVKHTFINKSVFHYGGDNGFCAETIRRFGAKEVTCSNVVNRDFSEEYYPEIIYDDVGASLKYDITVLMQGVETFENQVQLVKDIANQTRERAYILTPYGTESPHPIIGCSFDPYQQMPNLVWFSKMFKKHNFEIESVSRYRTQYLNYEMMFLSVYNSKNIDSKPIDIEKEWEWRE